MRIDAHQHFWRYTTEEFGWLEDNLSPLRRDFLSQDLNPILEAQNFRGCIAVQARQTLEENDFLLGIANEPNSKVLGVVGWLNLTEPNLEESLEHYRSHPKFVGVREILQGAPAGTLLQEPLHKGIQKVAAQGLTYDLLIYSDQLPEAIEFVKSLPEVKIVLDHCAKPKIHQNEWEPWSTHIKTLSQFPNLWVKLSGLPFEAGPNWSIEKVKPYYEQVLECFGPNRCMFGSDWPVSTAAGSFETMVQAVEAATESLTTAEKQAIFETNAENFYLRK